MSGAVQAVLHFIFDFLVVTIGLKIIAAHWLVEHAGPWVDAAFKKTGPRAAILAHELGRALREGGHAGPITRCQQDKCAGIY